MGYRIKRGSEKYRKKRCVTIEELKNTIIIIPPPPPPPSTPTDSQMPRTSTSLSSTDLPLAIRTRHSYTGLLIMSLVNSFEKNLTFAPS